MISSYPKAETQVLAPITTIRLRLAPYTRPTSEILCDFTQDRGGLQSEETGTADCCILEFWSIGKLKILQKKQRRRNIVSMYKGQITSPNIHAVEHPFLPKLSLHPSAFILSFARNRLADQPKRNRFADRARPTLAVFPTAGRIPPPRRSRRVSNRRQSG